MHRTVTSSVSSCDGGRSRRLEQGLWVPRALHPGVQRPQGSGGTLASDPRFRFSAGPRWPAPFSVLLVFSAMTWSCFETDESSLSKGKGSHLKVAFLTLSDCPAHPGRGQKLPDWSGLRADPPFRPSSSKQHSGFRPKTAGGQPARTGGAVRAGGGCGWRGSWQEQEQASSPARWRASPTGSARAPALGTRRRPLLKLNGGRRG